MSDDEEKSNNTDDSKLKMSKNVTLAVKLNGSNYPLWKKLMRIAIVGRRATRHITGKPSPPEPGEKGYTEWEESDMIVFSWILDNIDTNLVVDFAHHHTTKALWDSLAVTYESTADPYLLYDLEDKVGKMVQGDQELETYWRRLHGLWIEVDRCKPCPMNCCDKGIEQYRKSTGERRLFKFLTGLNERYDGIRRDILKESPLPSAEAAYRWVKREAARLKMNTPATPTDQTLADNGGIGMGFVARNQASQQPHHLQPSQRATVPPNHRGGPKPDM